MIYCMPLDYYILIITLFPNFKLFKPKFRAEKERNAVAQELEESTLMLQQDQAEKANSEKNGKMIQNQIADANLRYEKQNESPTIKALPLLNPL